MSELRKGMGMDRRELSSTTWATRTIQLLSSTKYQKFLVALIKFPLWLYISFSGPAALCFEIIASRPAAMLRPSRATPIRLLDVNDHNAQISEYACW